MRRPGPVARAAPPPGRSPSTRSRIIQVRGRCHPRARPPGVAPPAALEQRGRFDRLGAPCNQLAAHSWRRTESVSVKVNLEPRLIWLFTQIRPSWSSMNLRARERP